MSFVWIDFLRLAQELYTSPGLASGREAVLRTVISRAYYAAFCSARESLRKSGAFHPSYDDRDHLQVVLALKRGRLLRWADRLFYLRKTRNQADYEESVPSLEAVAALALADAAAIIGILH